MRQWSRCIGKLELGSNVRWSPAVVKELEEDLACCSSPQILYSPLGGTLDVPFAS